MSHEPLPIWTMPDLALRVQAPTFSDALHYLDWLSQGNLSQVQDGFRITLTEEGCFRYYAPYRLYPFAKSLTNRP